MFKRDPFLGIIKPCPVNLSDLHRPCIVLLHTINDNPFATFKINSDQAAKYITNLFYIYAILNLSQFFNHAMLLTKLPVQKYYVPQFVRDTFQCMCRPIPDGSELWVPQIMFDEIVIDSVLNDEILLFFSRVNIPVVPIIKESVPLLPFQAWGRLEGKRR
ncbi:hypothetical protein SBY92_005150 [Candida maltosa Xu316]|uniref:Uncharacterized protein n=1 Tax=Candida maltosa (strain Xu316) TaxID=1245528 RepID=M3JWZ7_CANMX|nr:hypothetical protein G210_2796 [Candida maltosa Xu316]